MKEGTDAGMSDSDYSSLRRGLLKFLILIIVSTDEVYAQDIIARLQATEFETQDGTLYPLLSRMRRDGLLDYRWSESDSGPPRKYYTLTKAGRHVVDDFSKYWSDTTQLIANLREAT